MTTYIFAAARAAVPGFRPPVVAQHNLGLGPGDGGVSLLQPEILGERPGVMVWYSIGFCFGYRGQE